MPLACRGQTFTQTSRWPPQNPVRPARHQRGPAPGPQRPGRVPKPASFSQARPRGAPPPPPPPRLRASRGSGPAPVGRRGADNGLNRTSAAESAGGRAAAPGRQHTRATAWSLGTVRPSPADAAPPWRGSGVAGPRTPEAALPGSGAPPPRPPLPPPRQARARGRQFRPGPPPPASGFLLRAHPAWLPAFRSSRLAHQMHSPFPHASVLPQRKL